MRPMHSSKHKQAAFPNDKVEKMAMEIGLSRKDFQSCLNQGSVDLETFMELSGSAFDEDNINYPPEMVKKVGTVTACVFKIHGVFRDSKFLTNELLQLMSRINGSKEPIPLPIVNIIRKCSAPGDSNDEEAVVAFNFMICFKQEIIKRRRH
ncbi:PREDICTED: uncharacterized protein LOC107073438 isoform X2 [Polistes dominula]|uniref:Uncharacterized protein LOC107073438 isoform X2 n=1 Tax=Polistes dominula TaxID=743375 RepID=A0ABM1JAS7_POLDO|nr:PREDICTED: uncharacterized protein LOC107073438 isoform X2 [Polistes dominula]